MLGQPCLTSCCDLLQEFWRRRNYELAVHWGVLNYEREEVKRPQFYGKLRNNPVTGKVEKVYSPFLRNAKHVVRRGCVH